jgi:hypothetical protein
MVRAMAVVEAYRIAFHPLRLYSLFGESMMAGTLPVACRNITVWQVSWFRPYAVLQCVVFAFQDASHNQ